LNLISQEDPMNVRALLSQLPAPPQTLTNFDLQLVALKHNVAFEEVSREARASAFDHSPAAAKVDLTGAADRTPGAAWRLLHPVEGSPAEARAEKLGLNPGQLDTVANTALRCAERTGSSPEQVRAHREVAQAVAFWLVDQIPNPLRPPPAGGGTWLQGRALIIDGLEKDWSSGLKRFLGKLGLGERPSISAENFTDGSRGLVHTPKQALEWELGLKSTWYSPEFVRSGISGWARTPAHELTHWPQRATPELLHAFLEVIPSRLADPEMKDALLALRFFPISETRNQLESALGGPHAEEAMRSIARAAPAYAPDQDHPFDHPRLIEQVKRTLVQDAQQDLARGDLQTPRLLAALQIAEATPERYAAEGTSLRAAFERFADKNEFTTRGRDRHPLSRISDEIADSTYHRQRNSLSSRLKIFS
jgi:hypothetical protein